MGDTVRITIDGTALSVPTGSSLMDACDQAGAYVPRLCAYPGLEPAGDCGLCFVRVQGAEGPAGARRACSVAATPGMVVWTTDEEALRFRRSSMEAILGDHPHVCLTCPQRDGCSRVECMYGHPPRDRCCGEFGRCEIAKVAAFVGALEQAPRYEFRGLGVTRENKIRRDLDLCIGCGRCVAACDTLPEAGRSLELAETAGLLGLSRLEGSPPAAGWEPRSYLGRHVAVPKKDTLRASGCTFCGACVMVCPTGALTAPGVKGAAWLAKRQGRTTLLPAVLPPEDMLAFTAENVAKVPSCEGVLRLLDGAGQVLQISGVLDLRRALEERLGGSLAGRAVFFSFEEDPTYTQRESELLALHLQERGRMPPGNDVLGEVFDDDDGEPF